MLILHTKYYKEMIIPTKEKETSGKVIIEEQRKWLLCFTLFMMGGGVVQTPNK